MLLGGCSAAVVDVQVSAVATAVGASQYGGWRWVAHGTVGGLCGVQYVPADRRSDAVIRRVGNPGAAGTAATLAGCDIAATGAATPRRARARNAGDGWLAAGWIPSQMVPVREGGAEDIRRRVTSQFKKASMHHADGVARRGGRAPRRCPQGGAWHASAFVVAAAVRRRERSGGCLGAAPSRRGGAAEDAMGLRGVTSPGVVVEEDRVGW